MTFSISGTKEIQNILTEIAPKHANNLMRSTIHGIASTIAKDAKENAPKATGALKINLKAQRKKSPPDKPVSEVKIKTAFYWRFVEYGTKSGVKEHGFIRKAVDKANTNLNQILTEQFGKKLQSMLAREAKKSAKNGL